MDQSLKEFGTTNMPEEKNEYALLNFKHDADGTLRFQVINFYKLHENGLYDNGTTLEDVLGVCIERLQNLNKRFFCRENSLALTKMQEALMWLNARTADRERRGVEGKHEA